ncbi:MAG: PPC domain-containing protein, partial [Gemmatimonadota bacterium]
MSRRPLLAATRPLALCLGLAAAAALPATGQQIAMGQMMSGTISMADPLFTDGTRFKQFMFYGQAGQNIQIDVVSSDFDAFCLLFDQNNNELARDDDGGDGLNARITRTLSYTGMYKIIVNSYRSGATGNFTVSLQGSGGMPMPVAVQPIPMANPSGVVGAIGVNQQVTGNLTGMDARWDGKPFQAYQFSCMAGQSLQVDVLSTWDNYALVFDPVGNVVARDDDTGEGLNARINYACPIAGTYRLAVTTYSSSTTPGQYTMTVSSQGGMPMPVTISTNPTGVVGTIAANQQVTGNLTGMDARWDGKPFQAY